ncbi:MAG: hypothetical protein FWD06_05930 [Oscillospiraceae bacterium]|nr:hypothetical protein [Oscillospiraceae bacterium]
MEIKKIFCVLLAVLVLMLGFAVVGVAVEETAAETEAYLHVELERHIIRWNEQTLSVAVSSNTDWQISWWRFNVAEDEWQQTSLTHDRSGTLEFIWSVTPNASATTMLEHRIVVVTTCGIEQSIDVWQQRSPFDFANNSLGVNLRDAMLWGHGGDDVMDIILTHSAVNNNLFWRFTAWMAPIYSAFLNAMSWAWLRTLMHVLTQIFIVVPLQMILLGLALLGI